MRYSVATVMVSLAEACRSFSSAAVCASAASLKRLLAPRATSAVVAPQRLAALKKARRSGMERERLMVLLLIGCPPVGCVSACSLMEEDDADLRRTAAAVAGRARSHNLPARPPGPGGEQ